MAYRTTSWKNTDIGKIPSDWDVKQFGNSCEINPPNKPLPDKFLYIDLESVVAGKLVKKSYVEAINAPSRAKRRVQYGDFLFQTVRPYQCNNFYFNIHIDNVVASTGYALIRSTGNDNKFIYYLVHMSGFVSEVLNLCTGTSYPSITPQKLACILISIPKNVKEQQKIAEVLTDLDDLIAELEKVRDKKQAIKIGAMQELLIPKPNWIYVSLKETMNFYNGYSFKSSTYNDTGKFKVITIANVQQGKMLFERVNRVSSLPVDIQPYQRLQRGDIILSMTGNVGRTCLVNADNCLLNQRVGKIEPKDNIDKHFLYVILQNDKFISNMIDASQGGAQPNLSLSDIQKYSFYMPTDKSEQSAIAEVLSDMDDEISAINDKINKYKQIKAGVADELLSGRIRLIKPQE